MRFRIDPARHCTCLCLLNGDPRGTEKNSVAPDHLPVLHGQPNFRLARPISVRCTLSTRSVTAAIVLSALILLTLLRALFARFFAFVLRGFLLRSSWCTFVREPLFVLSRVRCIIVSPVAHVRVNAGLGSWS